MRLSQYYLPIHKENPREAHIESHRLMIRSGMIAKHSSGLYSWLPLGLSVVKKIENIIIDNMKRAGFCQVLMPCIQPSGIWKESGRIKDYGQEMLTIKDRAGSELIFGPSNEEIAVDIFRSNIVSYRDLPQKIFHIQEKFRDEIRPRHGVMRSREFIMKDGYSFHSDRQDAIDTYFKIFDVYCDIFTQMGIEIVPAKAASGQIGGELNHEFHILSKNGDSLVYYDEKMLALDGPKDKKSIYAAIEEVHNPHEGENNERKIEKSKSIEVGHIFYFADKYSAPMNAKFTTKDGKVSNIYMGSYGIGISRLVAAIIEVNNDEKGIIWPSSIAPFQISLINLTPKDEKSYQIAENIYQELSKLKIDILYDDTSAGVASKLAAHDLIGMPYQIIIGKKLSSDGNLELKIRKNNESKIMSIDSAVQYFSK